MRHLTWQTQQVAAGDLDQRVDFLGDFSVAFNQMIQGLREKRAAEEKTRHLSLHDALTGLYNRTFFNEEIERLRSAQQYPVSFLIADLDGLKTANSTHGTAQVGDLLIQKATGTQSIDEPNVVTRIGGDEFAVILYGNNKATASAVMGRLRDVLETYNQRDQTFSISLSLGIGVADADLPLEALHQADEDMYRDKALRKTKMSGKLSDRNGSF